MKAKTKQPKPKGVWLFHFRNKIDLNFEPTMTEARARRKVKSYAEVRALQAKLEEANGALEKIHAIAPECQTCGEAQLFIAKAIARSTAIFTL